MLSHDSIATNEAFTVEEWNRFILDVLAPACRVIGERVTSIPATSWPLVQFDRQRSLFVVQAQTCMPGHYPAQINHTPGPAPAIAVMPYQFGIPCAGRLRRVYCRDGIGTVGEDIRFTRRDAGGVYVSDFSNSPAQPPFDFTDLDDAMDEDGFIQVEARQAATAVSRNYRVTFEFALDFQAGVS